MHMSVRYDGAVQRRHLLTNVLSLNRIRCRTRSQWRSSRMVLAMWSNFRLPVVSRAVAFNTDWIGHRWTSVSHSAFFWSSEGTQTQPCIHDQYAYTSTDTRCNWRGKIPCVYFSLAGVMVGFLITGKRIDKNRSRLPLLCNIRTE